MATNSPENDSALVPKYRPAVQVSQEIASLCHIYFDEKLYQSALNLVTALTSSGTSHPESLNIPALAPLPIHIEAVSILLVHPEYTTQAPQNERVELASRSISFLRNILSTLGPLNANLGEALSFTSPRSRGRRRNFGDDMSSDDEEETSRLKGVIMNKGRIRTCATDFWHVVGWALNCSVVHRKRWKYWKVWLDYMLDVLDEDWIARGAQDKANELAGDTFKMRENSLLVKYLSSVKGRSSALKRVIGSIFVDGGSEDLRAYPEVFENETSESRAQSGHKRKREDDFGDQSDGEDQFGFGSETPLPSQETDDGDWSSGPDPWLGGPESIKLRQRVLTLLSRVAFYLPNEFMDIGDLYNVYCDNLKSLPLPAFSLLMSPSASSHIPTAVIVTLSQVFMLRVLPNSAPQPHSVSVRNNDDLSQDVLEKCFLPFAATTSSTDDNAKVSILAESMLRLYLNNFKAYHTPELDEAIETGIKARENKCKNDKRRRDNSARRKDEEDDRRWLTGSGKRLRSMLNWIEQCSYSDEA